MKNKTMSRDWLSRLIDELRPSDSRINLVIRALLSSAIAIVISQTLQVPWLALSLIAVFFITQSNIVITRAIGILFFVSSTLAIGAAILVLKFTYDYPMLRILLSSALFFLSVFLMRVTKVGVLFFLMALVVIYTQSFVDLTPQAEVVIRLVLWVWVAINYAILLTLIVNTLLLPAEPLKQLKGRMIAVLDETRAMLAHGGETRDLSAISQHATELHKLLRFSVMRSDRCRANEPGYLALITLVLQLNILAYQLPPAFGAAARKLAQEIDAACRALQTAISHDSALRFSVAIAGSDDPQVPAPLNEMAGLLQVYANRSDYADALQTAPPPKVPFFTPDALTNPVYIQFSLKTLLTVLVAYVFYTAVDWSGIHTIMLSCLIVAQPSLGATQRRARLRLGGRQPAGAYLGGVDHASPQQPRRLAAADAAGDRPVSLDRRRLREDKLCRGTDPVHLFPGAAGKLRSGHRADRNPRSPDRHRAGGRVRHLHSRHAVAGIRRGVAAAAGCQRTAGTGALPRRREHKRHRHLAKDRGLRSGGGPGDAGAYLAVGG